MADKDPDSSISSMNKVVSQVGGQMVSLNQQKGRNLPLNNQDQTFNKYHQKRSNFWSIFNKLIGDMHKPWFHSPAFVGVGILLIFSLSLVIIPMTGIIAIPYPFLSKNNISFNANQTVEFNDYFTKSEFLSVGNKIDYSINGDSQVSVAITNKTVNGLPIEKVKTTGSVVDSFNLSDVYSIPLYLFKGDSINYTFNFPTLANLLSSDGYSENAFQVTFALNIFDQSNYNTWHNDYLYSNNPHSIPTSALNVDPWLSNATATGSFIAPYTQNWHLVWEIEIANSLYSSYIYNLSKPFQINLTLHYNVSSLNLTQTNLQTAKSGKITQESYEVPSSGVYTMIIYFNSKNLTTLSELYSYSIIFHQNLNSKDHWKLLETPLIILSLFIGILLIAVYGTRKNKRYESIQLALKREKDKIYYESKYSNKSATVSIKCPSCGSIQLETDFYCDICGAKLRFGSLEESKQYENK